MKDTISWFATSVLAAGIALGCQVGEEEAAPVRQTEALVAKAPESTPAHAPAPMQEPAPAVKQEPKPPGAGTQEPGDVPFLPNAFPPTVPDTEWHRDAWMQESCLRCHETGVGEAPQVAHRDLPPILLTAKCRTCHVFVPGSKPRARPAEPKDEGFEPNAFPPMIPGSDYHSRAWTRDDCLLCHESGVKGAPRIVHRGMPAILLASKCRTCHVQVRVVEVSGR